MEDLILFMGEGYSLTGLMIALAIVVLLVTLILYIIHLKNKLNNFENPKYGFLGKNIYPLIGFITLGSIIVFATYGVMDSTPSDTQANVSIDGQINASVVSQTLADVNVNFKFTPYLNGKAWGNTGDSFDIYWEIVGLDKYSEYELQKTSLNPSGFNIALPKGSYIVRITLVYEGENYKFEDRINY